MKLRIKGNSIRLRMTKSEVENIAKAISVSETVDIGNNKLVYTVISDDVAQLTAIFNGSALQVSIPHSFASSWDSNNIVGIQHHQQNENGTELLILIEKDFVCLDRTFEDQSDNYPHPGDGC